MAKIIIIAGPTASGKTKLAIEIAKYFNTGIINADSRQCFVEMNIGTAKASKHELCDVPHFFVNSHSVFQHTNTAVFLDIFNKTIEKHPNNIWVVSGGTGLYLKSIIEGLDDLPKIDVAVRQQVTNLYKSKGLTFLLDELRQRNDDFIYHKENQNPARVIRALETQIQTGKSILSFYKTKEFQNEHQFYSYCLELENTILQENINKRVDFMFENGLKNEVENLRPFLGHKNLNTVGYQEWKAYFDGEIDANKVKELIKIHTRQYAKRQKTWFRHQGDYQWISPENAISTIIEHVKMD